jgi:hypothetical protein
MFIGIHVNYPSFLSDCNETSILSRDVEEKYQDKKFRENPGSGS